RIVEETPIPSWGRSAETPRANSFAVPPRKDKLQSGRPPETSAGKKGRGRTLRMRQTRPFHGEGRSRRSGGPADPPEKGVMQQKARPGAAQHRPEASHATGYGAGP